ncbi:MAG: hypothetical protein M1832_002147 [Thelocarpon impressellum]|nr:MAG: hypothetical protein M1832_002147 [Thelocarpon impressellum]
MPDKPAWKPLLKKLSYESKGEGEAFIRFVMSRKQQRIGCKNSAWTYTRRLGGLYHNFTGSFLEQRLKTCLLGYIQSEITVTLALRREPKPKPCIGLDLFGGSPLEDRGHEVRARR